MTTMKRNLLSALAIALGPTCAFAVDGVVLINQSTVMAAGGFPYIISQPGSYKLASNLVMNTTLAGNYQRVDTAVVIASSNVALDLNDFTISVTNTFSNLTHLTFAIITSFTGGPYARISIRNGTVVVGGVFPHVDFNGISLSADHTVLEDLSVFVSDGTGFTIVTGVSSLIRHNVLGAPAGVGSEFTCPSLLVENVGLNPIFLGGSCLQVNNIN
jgi:hypothetical protein